MVEDLRRDRDDLCGALELLHLVGQLQCKLPDHPVYFPSGGVLALPAGFVGLDWQDQRDGVAESAFELAIGRIRLRVSLDALAGRGDGFVALREF